MDRVRYGFVIVCMAVGSSVLAGRIQAQNGSVIPLPPDDAKVITALLGPGVVGAALPSQPIQDSSAYFPLQERSMSYQVTSGPNVGAMQTLPVAKGKRPGGTPAWRFALSPSMAGFIRQTEDGLIM